MALGHFSWGEPSMTRDEDRSVEQFRGRLALLFLLKYTLAATTVWTFFYGSAVLSLRGALGWSREELLWGLCSLPVALIPGVMLAWRRVPSSAKVRALLDRHGHCGGLLMTEAEQPLGAWREQMPEIRPPAVAWQGRRSWGLFGVGLAFVGLAFLVPQGLANLGSNLLDISKEAEKLAKQLDALQQEKVLEKQRAGELKAKLEQVRREAQGKDPVKTLEALDHLQDVAHKAARDAAEAAARKMEELGRAEAFAKAMEKLGTRLDKNQLSEAMNEMAALARKAANERDLLESGLDAETLEAIKNSTLTPEQAKKLLEALKNAKEAEKGKIGRLVKAKLLKPEDLEKCENAGKCDCGELAAYLKENGAKSDLADALVEGEMDGEEGGRGGVTRGPGAAKLTFGDESSEEGTKFKEEELPPAKVQALKESQLSGISAGSPQTGKEKAGEGRSGALSGAKGGGGSATTQIILPRHRGSVERYFNREMTPKK